MIRPSNFKYRLRYQDEENYVLLQGESQINLAGLASGGYVLDILSQVNGIWSDKPFYLSLFMLSSIGGYPKVLKAFYCVIFHYCLKSCLVSATPDQYL